jgi:hypothetical protein
MKAAVSIDAPGFKLTSYLIGSLTTFFSDIMFLLLTSVVSFPGRN